MLKDEIRMNTSELDQIQYGEILSISPYTHTIIQVYVCFRFLV